MKTASPLRRKLWRDLWRTRAQGFTVVLLLAIGVGLMVASLGVRHSLIDARDAYYADNRLADLQVALVRAPRPLAARVAALPGVQALSARVVAGAIIELGVAEPPVSARVVSLVRVMQGELKPGDKMLVMSTGRAHQVDDQRVDHPPHALVHQAPPGQLGMIVAHGVGVARHQRHLE